MRNWYTLLLRLDSSVMGVGPQEDSTLSFGILFIYNRRFNGYHTRFQDIYHGGLCHVSKNNLNVMCLF